MEIQLRDYRIQPGHMDDWIAGWKGGVVPLRQQEGFQIVGAWVERYHALPERLSQHPNPSDFVEAATLDMVDGLL